MAPRAAVLLEYFGFQDARHYVGGKTDWLTRDLPVEGEEANAVCAGDLVRSAETCRVDDSTAAVLDQLRSADASFAVVVDDEGVILGQVSVDDLASVDDARVEGVMAYGPTTVRNSAGPELALDSMKANDAGQVLVTGPRGHLAGYLTREATEQAVSSQS